MPTKLTSKGRTLCLDSEAIGLLPQLIEGDSHSSHVIVCKDANTKEVFVFFDKYEDRNPEAREWLDGWEGEEDGSLLDGIKFINECNAVISQNFVGYDHYAFKKVFGDAYSFDIEGTPEHKTTLPFRTMDTLIMSRLLNPERRAPFQAMKLGRGNVGPHSIEAHGIRIGRYKPENEDWSKLTDHMIHRCIEDVEIGLNFYSFLRTEWKEQSAPNPATGLTIADAYRMELRIQAATTEQEMRGFRLDMFHALKTVNELDVLIEGILAEAVPKLPLRIKKSKINHTSMRKACEKAGYEYLTADALHTSSRSTAWSIVTAKGEFTANVKKSYPECSGNFNDHADPLVVGPYTPIVWERVSLGNRDIVKRKLYSMGWRGVNLTDSEAAHLEETGRLPYLHAGKLDGDSIKQWEKVATPPQWATDILKYYVYSHRRGQILNKKDCDYFEENGEFPKQASGRRECKGLVARARLDGEGTEFSDMLVKYGIGFFFDAGFTKDECWAVPSQAVAIGTNTHRMRHKWVVNIPSRGLYGKEMRQLFIARDGYKILGCDASGLELRVLNHFMRDPEYKDIILNGDIHTYNKDKAMLPTRDMAKSFIYMLLYGSGAEGMAMICGTEVDAMRKMMRNFLDEMPYLANLMDKVKRAGNARGFMKAIDGRVGHIRKKGKKYKEHTMLNVLLQMTGSVVVKWALYFAIEECRARNVDFRLLTVQHDEYQLEVKESEMQYTTYTIDAKDWDKEEKTPMKTVCGGYYSAPTIVSKGRDETLTVTRSYHEVGDILCKAFERTEEYLKFNMPMAGEYMIGNDWYDTH